MYMIYPSLNGGGKTNLTKKSSVCHELLINFKKTLAMKNYKYIYWIEEPSTTVSTHTCLV